MQVSRIQGRFTGVEVHVDRADEPGALDELPGEEEDEEDGDADVGGNEIVDAEGSAEGVEAVEDDDHGEEDKGGPGGVGLEGGLEHESVPVNPLGLEGFVELDVGDADTAPGEQPGDGGKVLEPCEDEVGAGGAGHVSQE